MNITLEQLVFLAEVCGLKASIESGKAANPNALEGEKCVILYENYAHWDPIHREKQTFLLLQTVLEKGNCELCYDDEYFIYQRRFTKTGRVKKNLLAQNSNLQHIIIDAALKLWWKEKR